MKQKIKVLSTLIMICVLVVSGFADVRVFAATIGSVLPCPESGWTRYDDMDPYIIYSEDWTANSSAIGNYQSTGHSTETESASYKFKFYGTKLRLIVKTKNNHPTNVPVIVDGVSYTYSEYSVDSKTTVIGFELTGLSRMVHEVEVTNPTAGQALHLDAIDLDGDLFSYEPTYLETTVITTESGNKAIKLTWDSIEGVYGYTIIKSTDQGMVRSLLTHTTLTEYIDENVMNNTTYYYEVWPMHLNIDGLSSNTAVATIRPTSPGDFLPYPEVGWSRFDDMNPNILYIGNWTADNTPNVTGNYQNTGHYTSIQSAKYKFKFTGTKFRLITRTRDSHPKNVTLKIDGYYRSFSEYSVEPQRNVMCFELTGLSTGVHTVEVLNPTSNKVIHLDAIDIDENGTLIPLADW